MTTFHHFISAMVITVCGLTACGKQPAEPAATTVAASQATHQQAVYRVGSELNKPPLVMHDGVGNVSGFEAELLQAIADKQGFKIEYQINDWSRLFSMLDNDTADILLGAVTITEERQAKMDFSHPVLDYTTGLLVTPDLGYAKHFAELKGKNVTIRRNTVYEKLKPILSNQDGSNISAPDTIWLQVKSLLNGRSQVMTGSSLTLEYYRNQYTDHHWQVIYEPQQSVSSYAFVVKKGNTALLNQLNTGLAQVKADGTYDRLYQKYWQKK